MAVYALTNGQCFVNAVDLSDHAVSFSLDETADALDVTAFNSGAVRSFTGGMKSATGNITFLQDFASSKVDATINGILGTTVAIILKGVNEGNSSTSPAWTFNAVITSYQPVTGNVSDVAKTQMNFTMTGALSRATS